MRPTDSSLATDQASGLDLLRRYRTLCEAQGLARANRLPLAESVAAELAAVEERLTELLEVASRLPRAVPPGPVAEKSSTSVRVEQVAAEPKRDGQLEARSAVAPSPGPLAAIIYTDGAAEGNPGPGGYCALVRIPGRPDRELSAGTNYTTNNKMELTAAVVGLGCAIEAGAETMTVVTDSEYLVKGMTRWLAGWKAKNWRTADGQPVKNRELWEQLDQLARGRSIQWQWIRGHAGHPENERCDLLATRAAREASRTS